jgi:hypothetical protein
VLFLHLSNLVFCFPSLFAIIIVIADFFFGSDSSLAVPF